ncbi:pentapeptide repeat-containing protein [Kribbella sp. VKM Ac-2566]|uniref:pentapeptide repeat-containing protein n=1 Tax=Kribbella sp. VKM Ac-2566 TaxID=2512218 RepID=UPI0014170504|nr:pentapeptide repeat-containing protein [Kribbella sp. VKM Ac-2566]
MQLIGGAMPALAIFAAGGMLAMRQRRLADRQLRFTQLGLARDLSGVALEGEDLQGIDLRHKSLRNANLRNADLRGASLLGSDLRGAELTGADLRGSTLDGADLRLAVLTGALLDGVRMHFADARGASFADASMRRFASHGSDFSFLSNDEVETLLADGIMRHRVHPRWARAWRPDSGERTYLVGVSAPGSSWVGTSLRNADLRRADLRSSNLSGEQFRPSFLREPGMTFLARIRSHIDEWQWVAASGYPVVSGALEPADLSEVNLTGADVRFTSLARVQLVGAELTDCRFDDGQLARAITVAAADPGDADDRFAEPRWLRFARSVRRALGAKPATGQ